MKRTAKKNRRKGQPLADPIRERYAGQRAMGMSQAAAFRKADPNAAKKTRGSIDTMAGRLEADPDVQARKAEILTDMLESSDAYLTKAKLAELLSDAIRRTLQDELLISSGAGLVDKYCKMFGFYEPEKHKVDLNAADPETVNRKVAALLNLNRTQHQKT